MIYLDNAATTRVDPKVAEAMLPYFTEKYGNASSLHSFGQEARKALEDARKVIADKINAKPEEIIFTSGGTEADNLAIKGYARYIKEKKKLEKAHIITSKIEHPAVLGTCASLIREGFEITYLDVDANGLIDLEQLKKSIREDTVLVSVMHANNEIGTIEPVEEISKICKEKGVVFHSDAVQSLCKLPIDSKDFDLISFSAHKIHGPKGIGALFVKEGIKLHKLMQGGHHEFRFRPGTENVAGAVGFAKAVEIYDESYATSMERLKDRLKEGLLKIPFTRLNGGGLCNIVNISFEYVEGESLLLKLNEEGIAVSTGSACSSHSLEASYVLLSLGLSHEIAHGSIRFSLSKWTTEADIDFVIEKTAKVVDGLRKISSMVE